jgi:hypothetical protein
MFPAAVAAVTCHGIVVHMMDASWQHPLDGLLSLINSVMRAVHVKLQSFTNRRMGSLFDVHNAASHL